MNPIEHARIALNDHTRAAKNVLAELGSRPWTAKDQQTFANHMDRAEAAQERLDSLLYNSGHQDTVLRQQREGIEIFLRKTPSSQTLPERRKVLNTMSTTTGSQGGYTLAPMVASEMVNLLKGYGWMRQVAGQFTTTNGADLSYPTSDGTTETGEMLAQNAPATLLDPSFSSMPIPTYRFSSKVFTVPIELLQDSAVDIVAFVMQRARDRIGRSQNAMFTTGTGSSQPNGLVTASSVGKTGTTGQTSTIIYDDLVDLADSVDEAHLGMPDTQSGLPSPTVGWMMSQTMRKVVRKLKDTNGRPIWVPGHLEGKTVGPAMLLDYPVYMNNDMPTPAASAKSLAFGNLGSYLIRDVADMTLYRFEDSAFLNKGQVGFLAFARAGGNLRDSGSVKLYQHPAT